MKKIFALFILITGLYAEEYDMPVINVESSPYEEHSFIPLQETVPGFKQPVINGLMGDKVLITVDGIKFNNALFRSGPNQYYSWIPDAFVIRNTKMDTLLDASLGGSVNREIGILESKIGADFSYNTFTGQATYKGYNIEVGAVYTKNQNVVDTNGEVPHSGYNQKGFYTKYKSSFGETKLLFSRSDDIDRTDKFEKGDYYVYDLQQYFLLKHTYTIPGTSISITPSFQQFREKIDRDSPDSKNVDSTDNVFGLNISDLRTDIFTGTDVLTYGIQDQYEDIRYKKGLTENTYYYNTVSIWAKYKNYFTKNWDYSLTGNFSWLQTKGSGIDRSMSGQAFGITTNYYFDETSYVFASVNTNFKFPTITNLAEARSDSVEELPNPNIDTEKAITYKVGVSYRGLELAAFYKKLDDMIIRKQTNIPVVGSPGEFMWQYDNADTGWIKGINVGYLYTSGDWSFEFHGDFIDGKTDYDYISKLQPIVTSTKVTYGGSFAEFLYAPKVPEDKMALKDQTDIRIKDHNYGYRILNLGYKYTTPNDKHEFGIYLDNALNDRGRVYGSSVDFNERRLRFSYNWYYDR